MSLYPAQPRHHRHHRYRFQSWPIRARLVRRPLRRVPTVPSKVFVGRLPDGQQWWRGPPGRAHVTSPPSILRRTYGFTLPSIFQAHYHASSNISGTRFLSIAFLSFHFSLNSHRHLSPSIHPHSPHAAPLLLAHQRNYPNHNPWNNAAALFTGTCHSLPCFRPVL